MKNFYEFLEQLDKNKGMITITVIEHGMPQTHIVERLETIKTNSWAGKRFGGVAIHAINEIGNPITLYLYTGYRVGAASLKPLSPYVLTFDTDPIEDKHSTNPELSLTKESAEELRIAIKNHTNDVLDLEQFPT